MTSSSTVPLIIEVSDGGEDGRIKWEGGPDRTSFVPNRFTLFQCKATDMRPSDCGKEVQLNDGSDLKPRVKEVISAGGCYILFFNQNCNIQHQQNRITSIRDAIRLFDPANADSASIEIYDAQKIADWTNEYLPAAIEVCQMVGRSLPEGILTWKAWSEYPDNSTFALVTNEKLDDQISKLKEYFSSQTPKKCARIVGLSGLGKSRLAFEVFKPPVHQSDDTVQQALSDSMVYMSTTVDPRRLCEMLCNWRNRGLSGVVVVDDCELDTHKMLAKEINHPSSKLGLLTLDFNPDEVFTTGDPYIKLEPTTDEVIKGMVSQAYSGLPGPEIDRIVEIAQGFPKMAVLLAEAHLRGDEDLCNLADDELVRKLLWGRGRANDDTYKILTGCAIFKYFNFSQTNTCEWCHIANNVCEVSDHLFFSTLSDFKSRGIINQRGDSAQVVPRPLAIRLAAVWWRRFPPQRVQGFIADLPEELASALCEQMAMMSTHPNIIIIIDELCGDGSPLGQAEVLTSEIGSKLFRYFTEINPEATISALERVFGGKTHDELYEIGPARRNLVWSLENLCFWAKTYVRAARLLLSFAEAENEAWSNNATGQFLKLHHLLLSGTQAPPAMRLSVIEEALAQNCKGKRMLAIKALGSGLESSHFSRMAGVERQGGRSPKEDWGPTTWQEVYDYTRDVLRLLLQVAREGDREERELARQEIVGGIRTLARYRMIDELESTIRFANIQGNRYWPEALTGVRDAIRYEAKKLQGEDIERLRRLEQSLVPQTTEDVLKTTVSTPGFEFDEGVDGKNINVSERNALELAERLSGDINWYSHIDIIFTGEQRQGFIFGKKMGEKVREPSLFLKASIEALHRIQCEQANPVVLAGFLAGLRGRDNALIANFVQCLEQDDLLTRYSTHFMASVGVDNQMLSMLTRMLSQGRVAIRDLSDFNYGRGMDCIQPSELSSFSLSLTDLGNEARWVALGLLYTYSSNNEERWGECRDAIKKIILLIDNISEDVHSAGMETYHWVSAVKKVDPDGEDEELLERTVFLAGSTLSKQEISINNTHELLDLIGHYFSKSPRASWDIIGGILLRGGSPLFLLTLKLSRWDRPQGSAIITLLPSYILIEWCGIHPVNGPVIVARLVPILEGAGDATSISDYVRELLCQYGDRIDVLDAIGSNLNSFGWNGSPLGHYNARIKALSELTTHQCPTVREWSSRQIGCIKKQIAMERKWSDEEALKNHR